MDGPLCANGRKKTDGRPFPAAVRSESLQFPALLAGEEAQGGSGAEHLAGPQHRGGELRVRGAAGVVLRFQRKAAVFLQRIRLGKGSARVPSSSCT